MARKRETHKEEERERERVREGERENVPPKCPQHEHHRRRHQIAARRVSGARPGQILINNHRGEREKKA